MYLLLRYPVGIIVEGVVLAKGKNRLRVVAADFPDTIELRRTGSQWHTSGGEPVELEFLMSGEQASSSRVLGMAMAAASPLV